MDIRITLALDLSPNLLAIFAALVDEGASPKPVKASATHMPTAPLSPPNADASPATVPVSAGSATASPGSPEAAGIGATATNGASPSDATVDAHGHPWSAELHASTKGTTKDGLWRMKVGVTRPDPMPGFSTDGPAAGAPNDSSGSTPTASTGAMASSENGAAPSQAAGTAAEDDDEFAAFRSAAAASDAADQAAAENVPARKWTDADLGALCNQAATKLGDPTPVKELIAEFTKEGEVAHSRNIDPSEREAFAQAVELKAGITFAG